VTCGAHTQSGAGPVSQTSELGADCLIQLLIDTIRSIYSRLPKSLSFGRFENHLVVRCHHRGFGYMGELTLGPEDDGE
jgi:hypothetical protein